MCNPGPDSTRPPGPRTDSPPLRQWHQATVAQRGCAAAPPPITIVESATPEGIREAAEGVETPGSYQAAQLGVAEQYVEKLGLLTKEKDTMVVPTIVGDVSSSIAERRTPYDRGRDHPALGNATFRSPFSRDVLHAESELPINPSPSNCRELVCIRNSARQVPGDNWPPEPSACNFPKVSTALKACRSLRVLPGGLAAAPSTPTSVRVRNSLPCPMQARRPRTQDRR